MAKRGMRLKVENADEILDALTKADEALRNELHNIISEAAEIVFREADARVPIKTGKARESLRIETGFDKKGFFHATIVVGGKSTYYITFYELGTSRQPPRPFLRPSLDDTRAEVRRYMISRLKDVIAKQGK